MATSPQTLLLIGIALTLIPLGLAVGTSYVKVSIVMSILRQGLGTQQAPSNVVIAALSLALSSIVMRPVLNDVWTNVGKIQVTGLEKKNVAEITATVEGTLTPWREFLFRHAGEREIATLDALSRRGDAATAPASLTNAKDISLSLLITAFLLTEMKEAFCMGFILLVPFLVVDVVVANLVVGLGLTMLNPTMVTLPLKLLLFFCADGWLAISRGIIRSYGLTP